MEQKLNEALITLKKAGFICEGSMSLEDKIENAKNYNKDTNDQLRKEYDKLKSEIAVKKRIHKWRDANGKFYPGAEKLAARFEQVQAEIESAVAKLPKLDLEEFFEGVREQIESELGYSVKVDIDNYDDERQAQMAVYYIDFPDDEAEVYVTVEEETGEIPIQFRHPNYEEVTTEEITDSQEETINNVAFWITSCGDNV